MSLVVVYLIIIVVVLMSIADNFEPICNTLLEITDVFRGFFGTSSGKYTTGGMGPFLENRGLRHERYMQKYFDKFAHGTAMDVGANCGFHTRELCRRCKHVIAVEPESSMLGVLHENAPRAHVLNSALGEKCGTIRLHCGANKSLCHVSNQSGVDQSGVDVRVDTIDNVMRGAPLNFLKIDVEGHEAEAVKGGINTITKYMPTIIYESNLFSQDRVKPILTALGYKIKPISLRDNLATPDVPATE